LDARQHRQKSRSPVNSQRQLQASNCQWSKKFLQLLTKYESLFDNTLGDWKTKPVSFQLKEGNNIPWSSFPSAKNTQDTLLTKLERLCKLGVLKQQQASKGALLSFKVPNKNKTVCFLAIFGT
jgi:hypothetical protein